MTNSSNENNLLEYARFSEIEHIPSDPWGDDNRQSNANAHKNPEVEQHLPRIDLDPTVGHL